MHASIYTVCVCVCIYTAVGWSVRTELPLPMDYQILLCHVMLAHCVLSITSTQCVKSLVQDTLKQQRKPLCG